MAMASLRRQVDDLRKTLARRTAADPTLEAVRRDPATILSRSGMTPDCWQTHVLRSSARRVLMLASRQSGKSQTAAALALREALLRPGSLVLLLSPTLRQSGELFRDKVMRLYRALGRPLAAEQETQLQLTLANGSRIVSLPGANEATIRGYSSVALAVIDEGARVADALYRAVRPMLSVSRGSLVCLSSAYAKLGWFYEEWIGSGDWERVKITAVECPRISPEFLVEERLALGPRWYAMEYLCEFGDLVDAVFADADVRGALSSDVKPLFVGADSR
jgi:hypothetical protein